MDHPPQSDAAPGMRPLDTSGSLLPRSELSGALPASARRSPLPAVTPLGREGAGLAARTPEEAILALALFLDTSRG